MEFAKYSWAPEVSCSMNLVSLAHAQQFCTLLCTGCSSQGEGGRGAPRPHLLQGAESVAQYGGSWPMRLRADKLTP